MFNSKIGTITPDELISEQARMIKDQQKLIASQARMIKDKQELIASLRKMIDSNSKQQKNLECIASYYKAKVQIGKTVEELAELIQALARGEAENIVEEMADVENMIAQLKFLFGVDTTRIRNEKINRQLERILEEKNTICISTEIKKTIVK